MPTVENMPPSEIMTPAILRKEGFTDIQWISLLNWQCPYDFKARKNGAEYLIEVKPHRRFINKVKLRRLKELAETGNSVLFLIVNVPKGSYYFLTLSEGGRRPAGRVIKVRLQGRIVIPKEIRESMNLQEGDGLVLDTYPIDAEKPTKILMEVIS